MPHELGALMLASPRYRVVPSRRRRPERDPGGEGSWTWAASCKGVGAQGWLQFHDFGV